MEYTKYPFLLQSGAPLFTFSASFFRGGEGVPHTLRQPFVNLTFHTVFCGRKKNKKTVGAFLERLAGWKKFYQSCSPTTGNRICLPVGNDKRNSGKETLNRSPERSGSFPVDDSHFKNSFLAASFEIIGNQLLYLARLKSMEVERPVDRYLNRFFLSFEIIRHRLENGSTSAIALTSARVLADGGKQGRVLPVFTIFFKSRGGSTDVRRPLVKWPLQPTSFADEAITSNTNQAMNIKTLLDCETILANHACPVHLALRFTAPEVASKRSTPIAFCLVLDRSSSMQGEPLRAAKEAARLVVRNLRKDDLFALVVFNDRAQVVVPLQTAENRTALLEAIDGIREGGMTNLTGGWMLGRDELRKVTGDHPRRLLLLTDGQLNVGITESEAVRQIVSAGMERYRITTSCLGFGDDYNEDLLALLANSTNASFYDATSPDQLPAIFEAELDGLQALAIQNLRVRFKRLDFCDQLEVFGDYPAIEGPDGILEITIGNLVSEEERTIVAALDVPAIPLIDGGKPAADLAGERLVEVEVLYDRLQPDQLSSHEWKQVVRVLPVQDEKDLRTNLEVIGLVSTQWAGKTLEAAIREADAGKVEEAKARLRKAIERLKSYPPSQATADGLQMLEKFLRRLDISGRWTVRERKLARYHSHFYQKQSSRDLWTGAVEDKPSFSRDPSKPKSKKTEDDDGSDDKKK